METDGFMRRALGMTMSVALAASLVACGPTDRPGRAGDTTGKNTAPLDDEAALAARNPPCEPWSQRECRVYWRDEHGQLHCPASIEVCRPGGRGWFACGEYQHDADGRLVHDDLDD